MTLPEAINILETYQLWRLGQVQEYPIMPKELTEALDIAIRLMTQLN